MRLILSLQNYSGMKLMWGHFPARFWRWGDRPYRVSDKVLTSGCVAVVVELTKPLHQLHGNASIGDDHQNERHDQQREVEKYRVHLHARHKLSYIRCAS